MEELGVCDAHAIITMVRNFEAQLIDMYDRFGSIGTAETSEALALIAQVQEMSRSLDGLYREKEFELSMRDNKPTMKAVWKENLPNEGTADEQR